ncbi:MAG TPA: NYN domain-containing protein [Acidobacteriota bacterium]|nr:NYN domain-containing protein [Acidobacteriota bacterium]
METPAKRVAFFVDGFNVYHSLAKSVRFRKYLWLDLNCLCGRFLRKGQEMVGVYYFSALAHWNNEKVKRHRMFLSALESVGVNIVLGKYGKVTRSARLYDPRRKGKISVIYETFEEKQSDVNIALYMHKMAVDDLYDEAAVISGDGDFVPAIRLVQEGPYNKRVRIILPVNQRGTDLSAVANEKAKIREKHLADSQFPESITLPNGMKLRKPDQWR